MNEKLTIQQLAEILQKKYELDKKDTENFIKVFFQLIEEGISNDKYVKIKGLGTFKLITVDNRSSIDVNTGKRIQIQSHTKIAFTPENALKELINKPFSHFETVVLKDGVLLDDTSTEKPEQDLEIEIDNQHDNNTTAENTSKEKETQVKEISQETIIEIPSIESPNTNINSAIKQENDSTANIPTVQNTTSESDKNNKKNSKLPIWCGRIAILLTLTAIGYFYIPNIQSIKNKQTNNISQKESLPQTVQQAVIKPDTIQNPIIKPAESSGTDKNKAIKPNLQVQNNKAKTAFEPDSTNYIIIGTKGTHTIKEGETLTRVALKYYGTKALWPYIVQHNPKTIKNPDSVPYGTTIKIPELQKKQ